MFLLLVATSLRLSEVLALQWANLDFRTGQLTVGRSAQRVCGQWVFSEMKTRSSVRTITLPDEVLAERDATKSVRQKCACALVRSGISLA